MAVIIDSYSESNYSTLGALFSISWTMAGNSFQASITANIKNVEFYLKKEGSPTGNVYAKLYSHSGTYGTSSVGNSLLATSDAVDASSIGTDFSLVNFTFTEVYQLQQSTYYCILVEYSGGSAGNVIGDGGDNTSPTHSGNSIRWSNDLGWNAYSSIDNIFYVYGEGSESASESRSPSASQSPSSSESRSESRSPSLSESLSPSASQSPSSSESPSPSVGWEIYSRGDYAALPANDTDLETNYLEQDYLDVNENDNTRVGQSATAQYAIHQFKDFVGAYSTCTLTCEVQSNTACTWSTAYLQIYNRSTLEWDTVDSDNTTAENTDFVLTAQIADLTNYKSASNTISCRVYQLAV